MSAQPADDDDGIILVLVEGEKDDNLIKIEISNEIEEDHANYDSDETYVESTDEEITFNKKRSTKKRRLQNNEKVSKKGSTKKRKVKFVKLEKKSLEDHANYDSDQTYVESTDEEIDNEEVSKKRSTKKRRVKNNEKVSKKGSTKKRKVKLVKPEQKSLVQMLREKQPELAENEDMLISTLVTLMNDTKCPSPPDDFAFQNDDDKFVCSVCGLKYETKMSARWHWQKKHGPSFCICYGCGVDFKDMKSLCNHERRCKAPDAKIVLKARTSKSELKPTGPGRKTVSIVQQLRDQHPELAEDDELLIKKLEQLLTAQTPPDPPQDFFLMEDCWFQCSTCGTQKESLKTITRHWQEQHGPRYLTCLACGWAFRHQGSHHKHERRCTAPDAALQLKARARVNQKRTKFVRSPKGEKDKHAGKPKGEKYRCAYCPAEYSQRSSVIAHERVHAGKRPYRCQLCAAAYTSRPGLTRHEKVHEDAIFICDHCACTFKTKECLRGHVRSHLPKLKQICPECGRQYAQKMALRIHIDRDHRHLPPPCACTICPKRYPKMSLLKKHMLEKHGMTLMTRSMFYRTLPHLSETQLHNAKIVTKVDLNPKNQLSKPVLLKDMKEEENGNKPTYEVPIIPVNQEVPLEVRLVEGADMSFDDVEESSLEHDRELLQYVNEVKETQDESNEPANKPFVVIKDGKAVFVDGSKMEFFEQNQSNQNDGDKVNQDLLSPKSSEEFNDEVLSRNNRVVALKIGNTVPRPSTSSPKTRVQKKVPKRKQQYRKVR